MRVLVLDGRINKRKRGKSRMPDWAAAVWVQAKKKRFGFGFGFTRECKLVRGKIEEIKRSCLVRWMDEGENNSAENDQDYVKW